MSNIISALTSFGNTVYFGNSVIRYFIAAGTFIAGYIIIIIIKKIVISRINKLIKKTSFKYGETIITEIRKHIVPLSYFILFYICLHQLVLPQKLASAFRACILIIFIFFLIRFIEGIALFWLNNIWLKTEMGSARKSASVAIGTVLKIVLWTIGFLIFLDNMGIKISAFITGLGIGGIAIAFAAQAVLGDIFSYFSIFFDNPFEIGDLIVIGDLSGNVEYIGLKTTRLRSLTGEEVVISNTLLTSSQLHNFKRMEERRIVFKIGVTYDTPPAILEEIPSIIENIIRKVDNAKFGRCHFLDFGDFSLIFETVFYVTTGDYTVYCNTHHKINMAIKQTFDDRKIEFAFPTQTLYISK